MTKMESDNPKDGNLISVNGIEMYYEDHGAGPALLLLHGGTGSSKGWEGYFDTFFGKPLVKYILTHTNRHRPGRHILTDVFSCRAAGGYKRDVR